MIVRVNHIDSVFVVDMDACRKPEISGTAAGSSDEEMESSPYVKYLEVVKGSIHHIDMAFAINCDSFGAGELTWAIPNLAKFFQKLPFEIEDLDAEIACVCDIEFAVADKEIGGEVQLAVLFAPLTKFKEKLPIGAVIDSYLVAARVSDIEAT